MKLDFDVGAAGPSVVFLDNVYFGVPRQRPARQYAYQLSVWESRAVALVMG